MNVSKFEIGKTYPTNQPGDTTTITVLDRLETTVIDNGCAVDTTTIAVRVGHSCDVFAELKVFEVFTDDYDSLFDETKEYVVFIDDEIPELIVYCFSHEVGSCEFI